MRQWKADDGKITSTRSANRRWKVGTARTLYIDGEPSGRVRKTGAGEFKAFDTYLRNVGIFNSLSGAGNALARRAGTFRL